MIVVRYATVFGRATEPKTNAMLLSPAPTGDEKRPLLLSGQALNQNSLHRVTSCPIAVSLTS
jgi:hypothetical protein